MRGPEKLVDRGYLRDPIAGLRQDGEVARQCQRIAGDGDDFFDDGASQFLGLELRAGAGWVEDDGVVVLQLLRHQRPAKEIAAFDRDRLQPLRVAGSVVEGCQGLFLAFDGVDATDARQAQREGAATGEEIGDALCLADMRGDQLDHRLFGGLRRLGEGARWR